MNKWLLLGLMVLGLLACGGKMPAKEPKTVLIAANDDQEVRSAIVRTLGGRHFKYYTAEKDEPGAIVVRWQKGERFFRVAIDYSPKSYTIKYLDSHDFDAEVDPETGTLMISRAYGKLTRRLAEGIEHELGRPARERAEAVAAQRGHQLQLEQQRTRQAEAQREAERLKRLPPPPAPAPAPQPLLPPIPVPSPQPVIIDRKHKQRHGSRSHTCCINGAYYECPNEQAFRSCMSLSSSQCTRKPSRDGKCK